MYWRSGANGLAPSGFFCPILTHALAVSMGFVLYCFAKYRSLVDEIDDEFFLNRSFGDELDAAMHRAIGAGMF